MVCNDIDVSTYIHIPIKYSVTPVFL